MRLEIADERFELLPSYAGVGSGRAQESGFECPVSWPHGNLEALSGRTVRFRIHLARRGDADPRLYAMYLRPSSAQQL